MATPATAWALRGNLRGPTGATGATGPTGAAGADGGTTPHASRHATGGSDPVSPASIGAIPSTLIGAASGVASLDSGSKIPTTQIPDLSAIYIATSRLDVSGGIPVLTGSVLPRKYNQYANTTQDGTIVLTGDLGGTATSPTVPGLAGKAATVHVHSGADLTSGTVAYARLPVGTAASTLAAGNDSRITGAEQTANRGVASGYASLDSGGKVPQAQLPSVALTDFLGAVASQAAMLALTGQRGDWCTRTDLGTDWQLITDDPTQLANWRQHVYPASPVSSVNGRVGPVTGLAESTDLAGYVPTTRTVTASTGLTGGGSLAADISLAVAYGSAAGTAAQGNDTRLSDARAWTLYTPSGENVGDVPTWNGTGYAPGAPAASVPNATSTITGGLRLTGDLGGTATAPTVPGLAGKQDTSAKGAASGYAGLDGSGDVPIAQLPIGTTGTTVAVGNDSRITGAEQTANRNVANGYAGLGSNGAVSSANLPAAGAAQYGILLLAGDLGGTAASPTVPGLTGKAATVHTHAGTDITSGTIAAARLPNVIAPPVTDTITSNAITPSASSSNNHFAAPSAATLTINAPTGPTSGQMVLIEVRPTVSCTITLAAAILLSGTLSATIGPVAANKSAHIGMRYSSTAAAWIVLAVQIQA